MKYLAAIEAILTNDETSTDAELVEHFIAELSLSRAEAEEWVAMRSNYLNPAADGIRAAKEDARRLTLGTPKTLEAAVLRIYMHVPMCDLKEYGYAVIKDFLSQRFGAAILAHGEDQRVTDVLSILFNDIVAREPKSEG